MTEAELKKTRQIRGGHRGYVTKLLGQVETSIANFQPSFEEKLSQQRILLQDKLDTLKGLDNKNLELEEDEESIQNEVLESSETTDQITWAMVRIDSTLKSLHIGSTVSSTPSAGNLSGHSGLNPSNSTPQNQVHAKLPKLELKRFSGKPTEWQAFIDSFDSAVHSNSRLNDIDKMNYLKSLLDGPAAASIKGLTLTSTNYEAARELLEERYGNKQLIISAHMDELLKLPVVNTVNDVKGIRLLYDKIEIHIRGLQALGVQSEQYGSLLVPVLLNKIPQELRLIISRKFSNENWKLDELLKVFKSEVEARERCGQVATTHPASSEKRGHLRQPPMSSQALLSPEAQRVSCTYCKHGHRSADCDVVNSIRERKEILRKYGRCFVCLKRGHLAKDCDPKRSCFKFLHRHHPSLCTSYDPPTSNNSVSNKDHPTRQGSEQGGSTTSMYVDSKTMILLQTCIALASNPDSRKSQIQQRAGSFWIVGARRPTSLTNLRKLWDLSQLQERSRVSFDCNSVKTVDVVNLCLKNVNSHETLVVAAHVVPMICSPLSNQTVQFAQQSHPHLADIVLSETGSEDTLEVDILIGADQYWNVANGETRRGKSGPVAMNTRFGWTIFGPVENTPSSDNHSDSVNLEVAHVLRVDTHINQADEELDNKLNTFWELESLGIKPEENSVLETFNEKITFRNQRYEVGLPWKEDHDPLPDNYSLSRRRLQSLLRRLRLKPEQLKEYDHVIKDQLERGIIERVDLSRQDKDGKIHYLPHHCVVREDKATTKLRVVYDASAKENGPALNDCLYTGPSLTPDILDILIRFRLHPVAVIADVEKAFLMVSVEENDRDSLRFLWVDDVELVEPKVVVYRFTRVVFGVTSSPFLLNATLLKHVTSYEKEDPEIVKLILRSLYVDDLSLSLKEVEEAYQLYLKSKERMNEGGFNLRKWLSNSSPLMEKITEMESQGEADLPQEGNSHVVEEDEPFNRIKVGGLGERDTSTEQKVLGTNWNYVDDEFLFKFQTHVESAHGLSPTKRNVLRVTAGCYDPMGLISPIIVQLKMLLQDICKAKYRWDTELDSQLKARWFKLITELETVNSICIPRCITAKMGDEGQTYELEGFGDASNSAYGAVVYLVTKSQGSARVQLIASKTRVSPLKKQTIPRLELMAALILARLISRIKKRLEPCLAISRTRCWTDSKNVLYWIKGKDKEWKQFVNNRVEEIRRLMPADVWNHVPGVENPADLASRGTSPSTLMTSTLWWNGPSWLLSIRETSNAADLPEPVNPPLECLKEMKVQAAHQELETASLVVTNSSQVGISQIMKCDDYSDVFKLYRVTAHILRFVRNLKARSAKPNYGVVMSGSLSIEELAISELLWIREMQETLKANAKFAQQCIQLGVVTDGDGIMRCKGRLGRSTLQPSAKYPIWLPADHHVTRLIIKDCHHRVMHNGVRETLMELRSLYWIIRGRQVVRKEIYSCSVCRRHEGQSYRAEPLSDLPEFRLKKDTHSQARVWTLRDPYT